MRKYCLLLLSICLTFTLFSQNPWTVQSVPNTRLQSNEIHVSDPDGFLSDSVEMEINTALCTIRDQADVFVVTLASIGDAEPKRFATQLFNYWGIGDAETDNGVLLLFVENQHALEFETGYGAEATLTDAQCQRIFTKSIVPFFRAGDYESGLCAGVAEIVNLYSGEIPMNLMPALPFVEPEDEGHDDFSVIFGLFAMVMFAMPWVGFFFWLKNRDEGSDFCNPQAKTEDGIIYIDSLKTTWSGSPWEGKGCLGGMMIGLSIFVFLFIVIFFVITKFPNLEGNGYYNGVSIVTMFLYLTWVCFRQNHRALKTANTLAKTSVNPKSVYQAAFDNSGNKIAMWIAPWLGWVYYFMLKKKIKQSGDCQCPMCSARMKKYGGFVLPEIHAVEQKLEALKFRPYRCGNGHIVVLKEQGKQYAQFKTCAKCGAYTSKQTKNIIIENASYSQNGKREVTYVCQHCGDVVTKTIVILKLVHYASRSSGGSYSSGSSGRSYSSSGHSHSSGGSFGGGHSGGGGYSGRW